MHPTPSTSPAAEPVELLLLAGLAVAEALLPLIAAALALLLALIGWRPRLREPRPLDRVMPAPTPAAPPAPALTGLRVVELRRLARAAGLPQLAHRGRKAELLAALA